MKPLRCATYNIRIGIETDLAQVAEALIALGPLDVVAFQEISNNWCMGERLDQTASLAAALGLPHHCFAGALTHGDGGQFGVALAARWPLEAVQRTPLPRRSDEQRVLLSATMHGPVAVRLFNTHLSVAPDERLAQARLVGAAVAAVPGPTVLFGDLNVGPDDPARRLAQGPLADCYDTCGTGPAHTFSVAEPGLRIDYIAAGGGLHPIAPCWVARDARASDHFPLAATLEHQSGTLPSPPGPSESLPSPVVDHLIHQAPSSGLCQESAGPQDARSDYLIGALAAFGEAGNLWADAA